jgi:hypothetical protein
LDAIDATSLDIIERRLENYSMRPQSVAIASNNGRSSSAVLAGTWLGPVARDFWSVGLRRPSGRGGEACELFKIYADRPQRIRRCPWTTFREWRCEALPRHGRSHRRYCDMNASWEDA